MTGNTGERNWLERLTEKIPGYSGYVDRERRREIDKMHREHLADRIRALKSPISDLVGELTTTGRLTEVGPLDRALKKVDGIENRIRFASYGYSGFFDVVKIEAQQLESIYRFDLALAEQVEQLEAGVANLKSQGATAEGLKAGSAAISQGVDELDRAFEKRYEAINNFEKDQPPGRPLFDQ